MRNFIFAILLVCIGLSTSAQGVLIGDTAQPPHPDALLELRGSRALLMPRLNTTQRNALQNPVPGMQIYHIDDQCVEVYFPSQGWSDVACDCPNPPSAGFSFSPSSPNLNQSVTFTPASGGLNYQWTFASGTPASSNASSPQVSWTQAGNYNVQLVVTDNTGCTDTSNQSVTVNACNPQSGNQTFNYTGSMQTFTVPACITNLQVTLYGAEGGQRNSQPGGQGGMVSGDLAVSPGQLVYVYVGGRGANQQTAGWNGGGIGDFQAGGEAGGGGGASDLRLNGTNLSDRVAVAGGGGGSGWNRAGGQGGGSTGGAGQGPYPGQGGTQSAGGAQGVDLCNNQTSAPGILGQGGNGASGGCGSGGGGGGGGGYYGGGGGGTNNPDLGSGGGGGSNYTGGLTNASGSSGVRSGDGQILISW